MAIILLIVFVAISAALGSSKGYNGVLCGVAGFFGGLIAIIIIAILPNKKEEEQEQEYARYRASQQDKEIMALRKQIRDLEAAQKTAPPQGEGSKSDQSTEIDL